MKPTPTELESITIRRAKIADADKVRYRVYSSPKDYIAVIAESALMAVKVSGVSKPHKIVRDLPTEGVAIEAERMAKVDEAHERVAMAVKQQQIQERLKAELAPNDAEAKGALFKPLGIKDLQRRGLTKGSILPPEMLYEIIGGHLKAETPAAEVAKPAVTAPVAEPEPVAMEPVAPPPSPEPETSPEERITQLAAELLPSKADIAESNENLSPDEVEKLLNG